MLDAENAIEQRGEGRKEAETAYEYDLSIPESMLEYLKQKEKVDLLRTIPAKLNPSLQKKRGNTLTRSRIRINCKHEQH